MDSDARYAIHVSKTLDCMGYNREMVSYRVRSLKEASYYASNVSLNVNLTVVGSKGEGLSTLCQSDFDYMATGNDTMCSVNPEARDIRTYPTVFQMEYCDSPSGYTKLKLIKLTENDSIENAIMYISEKGFYISNEITFL